MKEFAAFSDNSVIKRERHLDKHTERLIKEQRKLSRRTKGSNNRKKQITKVQTIHRKIRNARKDFLHKNSSDTIAKYSGVVLEDLNVSGMMKNHKLAKSISDVGWCEFGRMLEYKSLWNAKHYIEIDRWFASSKICSQCGNKKVDLTLKDRTYVCENCGNILDRDFNASKNIRDEGIKILTTQGHWESNACGDDKVHFSSVKKKKVIVREARKVLTKIIS